MNIFVLSNDPIKSAQMLCDKHVCKMIVKSCQLLCNITKQIKRKYRIIKDYNVKTVIITNDNTFKGLFDKQGYKCSKKYLDQIFTKKQIELLLQGLIDYLLVI